MGVVEVVILVKSVLEKKKGIDVCSGKILNN